MAALIQVVVVIEEAFNPVVASIPVAVIGVAFNPVVASNPVEVVQDEEVSVQVVGKIARAVSDRQETKEMGFTSGSTSAFGSRSDGNRDGSNDGGKPSGAGWRAQNDDSSGGRTMTINNSSMGNVRPVLEDDHS